MGRTFTKYQRKQISLIVQETNKKHTHKYIYKLNNGSIHDPAIIFGMGGWLSGWDV